MKDRAKFVNDFLDKLHNGEYIIDGKARDILYDNNKTLSEALSKALNDWEGISAISLTPPSISATYPYMVITSAIVHGVILEKRDLRKIIRETEQLVEKCESEKEELREIIEKAKKDLALCKYTNETLKKQLGHKSFNTGDVNE